VKSGSIGIAMIQSFPAVCHYNCISSAAVLSSLQISDGRSVVSKRCRPIAKLMNLPHNSLFDVEWGRSAMLEKVWKSWQSHFIPLFIILQIWILSSSVYEIHLVALALALFSSRMMLLTISTCLPHQTHLPK